MSYEYPELTLLGSTGSIGRQALELADAKNIKINGLAANKSVAEVEKQARRFMPSFCVMSDPRAAADLKDRLADTEITVLLRSRYPASANRFTSRPSVAGSQDT